MTTNKNKRTTKSRKASSTKKEDAAQTAASYSNKSSSSSLLPADDENVTQGLFTTGQGTTLVFLAMGISRLMQIGAAIRKETISNDNDEEENHMMNEIEAAVGCLRFFNGTGVASADWTPEHTCAEDGFHTLLQYKYATGWQVAAIVTAVMLQCWNQEAWMRLFNVALLLAPVLLGSLSLFLLEPMLVSRTQVWPQIIMGLVLSAIGRPGTWKDIPFLGGALPASVPPRNYTKSLQSLVILALAGWFLFQSTVQWGGPLLVKVWEFRQAWMDGSAQGNVVMASADMLSVINSELISATSSATQSPSSAAIALFLLVDKLTMAMAFFFAWFYLPEQKQRTLLLYTGVVFFCNATYLYPFLGQRIAHASHFRTVDWTIAGCSILTWIAPALAIGWNGSTSKADNNTSSGSGTGEEEEKVKAE